MTNEEIAVKFTEHHQEIGSLKHRVKELEDLNKTIQYLAISVNELAVNMNGMLKEQERLSARIESLESVPSSRWNTVVIAGITAIVSAFVTAAVSAMF